jgi:WD40 repeat protein
MHSGPVTAVAVAADNSFIVTGSDDETVRIWDFKSGIETVTLKGHNNPIRSIVVAPDGRRLFTAARDILVWDTQTRALITKIEGHTEDILALAIDEGGSRIVSGSKDRSIKIWDASSGAQLSSITLDVDNITSIAFSPDATRVAIGSYQYSGSREKIVTIWTLPRAND